MLKKARQVLNISGFRELTDGQSSWWFQTDALRRNEVTQKGQLAWGELYFRQFHRKSHCLKTWEQFTQMNKLILHISLVYD